MSFLFLTFFMYYALEYIYIEVESLATSFHLKRA